MAAILSFDPFVEKLTGSLLKRLRPFHIFLLGMCARRFRLSGMWPNLQRISKCPCLGLLLYAVPLSRIATFAAHLPAISTSSICRTAFSVLPSLPSPSSSNSLSKQKTDPSIDAASRVYRDRLDLASLLLRHSWSLGDLGSSALASVRRSEKLPSRSHSL